MDDRALLRYSRHILLDEFGIEAQQKLSDCSMLVVGVGGLGSAAAPYLASAGVGRLVLADGDHVELSNLQRQIAHTEAAIGVNKAESAATMLRALNSDIEIVALERRLADDLEGVVAHADVVLDCSDNFATRHAVNRACVRHAKPLVSGAAIRFDGQVTCFDPRRVDSPCYHCLFPDLPGAVDERCALMGVFAPLVGIIGSLQAAQAISLATGVGEPLIGTLLMLEGKAMRWQSVRFRRDPACPVCGRPSVAGSNFQEESEREVERA